MTSPGHPVADAASILDAGDSVGEYASPRGPGHGEGLARESSPSAVVRLVSPGPDADRRGAGDFVGLVHPGRRRMLMVPGQCGHDGAAGLTLVRQPDGTRVGLVFTMAPTSNREPVLRARTP